MDFLCIKFILIPYAPPSLELIFASNVFVPAFNARLNLTLFTCASIKVLGLTSCYGYSNNGAYIGFQC